jgi:hypothetical protein
MHEFQKGDYTSIKISRIKKAYTEVMDNSLAEHYIVRKENAERKSIKIDKNLITDLII